MKGRPSNSTVKAKRAMGSGVDPAARRYLIAAQQFARRHGALAGALDQRRADAAMAAADQQAVVEQFARRAFIPLDMGGKDAEAPAAIFEEGAGHRVEGAHLPFDLMRVAAEMHPIGRPSGRGREGP